MSKSESCQVNLRVPPNVRQALRVFARRRGMSVKMFICRMLVDHIAAEGEEFAEIANSLGAEVFGAP